MEKPKAVFVAVVFMVLLGAVLWCLWSFAERSFRIFSLLFAGYGFVMFGVHFTRWLGGE